MYRKNLQIIKKNIVRLNGDIITQSNVVKYLGMQVNRDTYMEIPVSRPKLNKLN